MNGTTALIRKPMMPKDMQMNGLRRNDDAMKINAGDIIILNFEL